MTSLTEPSRDLAGRQASFRTLRELKVPPVSHWRHLLGGRSRGPSGMGWGGAALVPSSPVRRLQRRALTCPRDVRRIRHSASQHSRPVRDKISHGKAFRGRRGTSTWVLLAGHVPRACYRHWVSHPPTAYGGSGPRDIAADSRSSDQLSEGHQHCRQGIPEGRFGNAGCRQGC